MLLVVRGRPLIQCVLRSRVSVRACVKVELAHSKRLWVLEVNFENPDNWLAPSGKEKEKSQILQGASLRVASSLWCSRNYVVAPLQFGLLAGDTGVSPRFV